MGRVLAFLIALVLVLALRRRDRALANLGLVALLGPIVLVFLTGSATGAELGFSLWTGWLSRLRHGPPLGSSWAVVGLLLAASVGVSWAARRGRPPARRPLAATALAATAGTLGLAAVGAHDVVVWLGSDPSPKMVDVRQTAEYAITAPLCSGLVPHQERLQDLPAVRRAALGAGRYAINDNFVVLPDPLRTGTVSAHTWRDAAVLLLPRDPSRRDQAVRCGSTTERLTGEALGSALRALGDDADDAVE